MEVIMLTIVLSLFLLVTLVTVIFLAKELVKKFRFLKGYTDNNKNCLRWHYRGSVAEGYKPGMHTIVLYNTSGLEFTAVAAFELLLPFGIKGVDKFGLIKSRGAGVAAFSTYLGKGECDFIFLINGAKPEQIERSIDMTGEIVPTQTYPPHWWQRLGFWG